ncbi:TMV resistance protein N-like protein, partial [Tanacetum coccineum]
MEGFEDLTLELAQYCGGNPLAIKVLGSSLIVRAEDSEKRNSIIEIWRSELNLLNSSKGDLYSNIQRILQKSFDSLPYTSYKELFLHIAIFFVGEDEDYVANILEDDWHAKAGIKTLINRCMLTVSKSKKLMMHQLLQDMGKGIVREESK